MEPASKIVKALGGPSAVARIVGVHRTRVHGWMAPRETGGTGGLIPLRHVGKIISAASEKGVRLTGDDFLPDTGTDNTHPQAHGVPSQADQGAGG